MRFPVPIAGSFCVLMTLVGCSSKQANEADGWQANQEAAVETVPNSNPEHSFVAPSPEPIAKSNSDLRRESAPQPEYSVLPPQPDARFQSPQAMQLEPRAMQSPQAMQMQAPAMQMQATAAAETRRSLPAGTQHDADAGYATVQVFYATDRMRGPLSLADYEITGQKQVVQLIAVVSIALFLFALVNWMRGRTRTGGLAAMMGAATACLAAAFISMGQANIEKHGVTYLGDRGTLVRGICEVTVPDSHRRGLVERPSLLKFELHENQRDHIVLTSAVELAATDFHQRLSETVAQSSDQDLLVFIHGYNVGFEAAVQRTAQIAVDLPFEGVPVCYSWPSQASLMGYTIDENNSEWTIAHLKQFLTELAEESGAKSINVVAHSMGNRAMTAAMQQIRWELPIDAPAPFDRIVLAAPDVDADRFRRDLAPALLDVSNQVTLYASSDDQALIASKKVHGYPRAGESGDNIVVVPGVETIDVSGIDLSLLGHSYYGDNESMLRDLYELVRSRLPAPQRNMLIAKQAGELIYWQLAQQAPVPLR
ncbi:alpha/beta hydrolase [Novipirellula caenicola]|uniref:Alpha/beta hydrolase family protein n=1 Tax=Novipirellula caenicola TaxID=1536901 RepID=A0ABP9W3S5_9BACT